MPAPDVRLIAAVGRSRQIGLNGGLPWSRADGDLPFFKAETMGGLVLVGFWTALEMPRDLPGRTLVGDLKSEPPAELAARLLAQYTPPSGILWVAGGAKTYARWIASGIVRHYVLTSIDYDGPADTYLPRLPWERDPRN